MLLVPQDGTGRSGYTLFGSKAICPSRQALGNLPLKDVYAADGAAVYPVSRSFYQASTAANLEREVADVPVTKDVTFCSRLS